MIDAEFENLHKNLAEKARKLTLKKGGIDPTIILGKDDALTLVCIPNIPGVSIADLVTPVSRSSGADYIFFMSEAWTAPDESCRPTNHPDRKEILLVTAEHLKHGNRVLQFEILRNDSGNVSSVKPMKVEYDQVGGKLASLLVGGEGTGEVVNIHRHPGYKSHFKTPGYSLH
jgi:hypothetical protein